MRAFTSWRVTFSRALMESRSTTVSARSYAAITASGSSREKSTPRSRWAESTATHRRRSAMIFSSGLQMARIWADAYRLARTLGIDT